MKRSISPVRSLLAVALAMAAAPVLAQDGPYTQTVFFGDSLTDAGYFRPLLPASVRPVTGQFTTNPGFVWSQYLAEYYGSNASVAWPEATSKNPITGTTDGGRKARPGRWRC